MNIDQRQKQDNELPAFEMEFDNDAKVRVMFDFTGDWADLMQTDGDQDRAEDDFVLAVATLVAAHMKG